MCQLELRMLTSSSPPRVLVVPGASCRHSPSTPNMPPCSESTESGVSGAVLSWGARSSYANQPMFIQYASVSHRGFELPL